MVSFLCWNHDITSFHVFGGNIFHENIPEEVGHDLFGCIQLYEILINSVCSPIHFSHLLARVYAVYPDLFLSRILQTLDSFLYYLKVHSNNAPSSGKAIVV